MPIVINIKFLCSLNIKSGGLTEKLEVLLRESSWLNTGQVDGQRKKLEWEFIINHICKAFWGLPTSQQKRSDDPVSGDGIKELIQ